MPNTDVSSHEYHCPKASSSCALAESLPMIYRKHRKSLPISAKLCAVKLIYNARADGRSARSLLIGCLNIFGLVHNILHR